MELVLDTNVLISGLLSSRNPPGRIVDGIRAGRLSLVVDDRILAEYRAVLRRPVFDRYVTAAERDWIIGFLETESRRVIAGLRIDSLPDPNDASFIEVATEAGLPLVTGNLKHYPKRSRAGIVVLSPRAFVEHWK